MNNTTKILTALAIGAAAGAILGILYAPDKGSETRKKINEEGKKMADAIKNRYNDMKEKMSASKSDMDRSEKYA